MLTTVTALLLCSCTTLIHSVCFNPTPAFHVPQWEHGIKTLSTAFESIEKRLKTLISEEAYNTSSLSVEVTSQSATLWTSHHTARERNTTRPGKSVVDSQSVYRIASISKVFTVLGILYQQRAGNLSLDDPVKDYIPELAADDAGEIPWHDITIRSMASQLSGIPRDFDLTDALATPDPTKWGFPPADRSSLPHCVNSETPCTSKDLLQSAKKSKPVFAPNQKSTYSNVAFSLLGLVLENVTGMNYSRYIETAILEPLGLDFASLEKPDDEHAVLTLGENWWDVDEGVQRPTGGLYASSSDMSTFSRYILTHYNGIATGVNWFQPASWSASGSTYGMPFEIYRSENLLPNTRRPVTFVTKSGALPSYFSRIVMMPEYGLGFSVLVAGDQVLVQKIVSIVTEALLPVAEEAVWTHVSGHHDGVYTPTEGSQLKSSLTLATHSSTGLAMTEFVSNSTDVLHAVLPLLGEIDTSLPWHAQLVPTLLYKNEEEQKGEIWRILAVQDKSGARTEPWEDFCIGNWDILSYAGMPVNEIVFWGEGRVELPAWGVNLTMEEAPRVVMQEL
ncbi:hypothetical protein MBLNU230_g2895t1 [Neophaeotheca triangularis]